jgi:di/tricarboxylate transporter
MNDINFTFIVLFFTIGFFIWGKLRSDLVALISMLALLLGGVLTTNDAFSGFSNSTVIMIAALFVVGEGLSRTGVTAWLARQVVVLAGNNWARIMGVMMIGTAFLSAFISNTGTVATLLPAVVAIAWRIDSRPSKLLIPLAFAANAGGLLTLTGTPPNIVVSDALRAAGYTPFSFFEYGYIGLPLLGVAVLYMLFVGQWLLPENNAGSRPEDLEHAMQGMVDTFLLDGKLFAAQIPENSPMVGKTLGACALGADYNVSVLQVERAGCAEQKKRGKEETIERPDQNTIILNGDMLILKGASKAVRQAADDKGIQIKQIPLGKAEQSALFVSSEVGMAELFITPRSAYLGKRISEVGLWQKYGIQAVSLLRDGRAIHRGKSRFEVGDALLVRGLWKDLELLRGHRDKFAVIGSPEELSKQVVVLSLKSIIAVASLVAMIFMMVTGWVATVTAAVITAVVMVLGRCLDMKQAYNSLGLQSIVLIAYMIPLSLALETTGGAKLMAEGLVNVLGSIHPLALMAGVFLLTSFFSQVINNTATAVLMAPIVLNAAELSGLSPYPLLITVSVSASTAFLTPIGTTTNLMVMTPGGYSFNDYLKTGTPLVAIFLAVSLLLIPIIWPF